jgi:acyl transferase domain-containing protein/acyl carrier protein
MGNKSWERSQEPIALIGIGCRFPGNAQTPQAFWRLLLDGVDAVGDIPAGRWDVQRYYHPDPAQPGKMYTQQGAFLQRCDLFDATFFGISPLEVRQMDPQHRLLLEVCWEALEDAGLVPQKVAGTPTGVFIGICSADYIAVQQQDVASLNAYSNAGGAMSMAANRISYFFDFRGPSLSIDTACSSSLVGVHLACESLWTGECNLALVGGVNIILDPGLGIGFCKAHMLSPHGRCSTFDAEADGYVRGEGAGVVVLKPLAQALADGDPIYATILATGTNQVGKSAGRLQPGRQSQIDLLREVYHQAGITPQRVHYIETHGTGTPVGDPIECEALGAVLGVGRPDGQRLRIGSVKTNIGHLEGASGIASVIKAALVLKHRQVPANLHFHTPNPEIPFEKLHLQVQQEAEALPDDGSPLVVGVNNFGFGGTNAHIVLQEFIPSAGAASPDIPPYVLPLSARSQQALHALAQAYLDMLRVLSAPALHDLCYTASTRREHHSHRLALVVQSREDLIEQLEHVLGAEKHVGIIPGPLPTESKPEIAFVFTGNGPQWWAMGRQLLTEEPRFRAIIERCDHALRRFTDWSLLDELRAPETASRMHRTDIAQPALFALQIALAALWQAWGIEPRVVIGHSVGEIAAAYVAGILSFEDAISVVFHRSRLQELTAGMGKMVAVGLSAEEAAALIAPYEGRISLASINAPNSVTLSGEEKALEQIIAQLEDQGVFCRYLPLNYAFHSPSMDSVHEELLRSLHDLRPQQAGIPCISTVTGQKLTGPECTADYWWRNIRYPVQFVAAIGQAVADGATIFLEIGPHPALSSYIANCLATEGKQGLILSSLRRREDERVRLLKSLGALYVRGCSIRWQGVIANGRHVALPFYPWQRESYWCAPEMLLRYPSVHPLLGRRLATAHPTWESRVSTHLLSYLADHRVYDSIIFPAAGYIEMALAAAMDTLGESSCVIRQLDILKPLFLDQTSSSILQTVISMENHSFHLYHQLSDDSWALYATGHVQKFPQPASVPYLDLNEIRRRCPRHISRPELYQELCHLGLLYGTHFQGVEHIYAGENEALGMVNWSEALQREGADYRFHPALLDSCLQVALGIFTMAGQEQQLAYLPVGMESIRSFAPAHPDKQLYCYTRLVKWGADYCKLDYTILDEEGQTVMEIQGLRTQAVRFLQERQGGEARHYLYEARWLPALLPRQQLDARFLPSPTQLVSELQPSIRPIDNESALVQFYQQGYLLLAHLCTAYLITALQKLGWSFCPGERFRVATRLEQLGILACYEQLLTIWCMLLADDGFLKPDNDEWIVLQTPEEAKPEELLREALSAFPDGLANVLLIARCGRCLPEVLTGSIDPLSVIFSEEAFTTVEHLYESGLRARRNNRLIQETLKAVVDRLPENRPLRILEIGAGTGGTTTYLLPLLSEQTAEYVFTDISDTFLRRAQQKYHNYPFVRYQGLNIEQDPGQQGLEEHAFDLIIASNVLHATRAIGETLNHIQLLLAPQGMLCLAEIVEPYCRPMLLVFGLLKDYWRFQDKDVRRLQPLLRKQQWLDLLDEAGFVETAILEHQQKRCEMDQAIFLAQAPVREQESPSVEAAPSAGEGNWLLFADETGVATQIQDLLSTHAGNIVLVDKGEQYQHLTAHHFILRPGNAADIQQLLQTLQQEDCTCERIVYLWGLDSMEQGITAAELDAAVDRSCLGLLSLVQELAKVEYSPRLWIITSGVQALQGSEEHVSIAQAPLYGLGRVVQNECPELHCTLIDISARAQRHNTFPDHANEIGMLTEALLHSQEDEGEILLRGNARFVNRIMHAPLESSIRADKVRALDSLSFRLDMETPGVLDNLMLRTVPRSSPKRGEVEIAVAATGLNFKDVMLAMGVIAGEALEAGYGGGFGLGLECAGTIVALGEDVTDFQVGDEVIALGRHCFSSLLTTDARLVVQKPASMSFEEGATLLVAFLTAHYALLHQGKLRAGERVLIHGAAGGVGLAAIQVVQQAGGEIFATAGSPEKRAYLRALGVKHVLDSRSLAFADEIMQITNGEGVDIVLNSLAGEAMSRSLSVLRRFGRFLEIGKRDFLENSKLELRPFQHCLSYFAIDIDQLLHQEQALMQQVFHELSECFEQGRYRPLPYRPFQLAQIVDAFRYMQQSRHIGKIVVSLQQPYAPVRSLMEKQAYAFRQDASYLITGGVSGFGLATARWMVKHGARYLVLVNRSGIASEEALQAMEAMEASGAQVLLIGADVTLEREVSKLLETVRATFPPLRGIMHAAMVLEDCSLLHLTESSLKKVLAPKMLGAWNLHVQTLEMPLDCFVLFSSISSLIGNVGQGNYVAGNAFLDALALYRRARGLPALTVNWGSLAKVGYVARHSDVLEALARRGLGALPPELALDILGQLLQANRSLVSVAAVEWEKLDALAGTALHTRLERLLSKERGENHEQDQEEDFYKALLRKEPAERLEMVQARLIQMLSNILGPSISMIDPQSKQNMGLDSLMAMELYSSIKQQMGVDLPIKKLLQIQSIADISAALTELLLEKLQAKR